MKTPLIKLLGRGVLCGTALAAFLMASHDDAQAAAIGYSSLQVTGVQLSNTNTGNQLVQGVDVTVSTVSNIGTNSVIINQIGFASNPPDNSASSNTLGGTVDAPRLCVGNCTSAENDFTTQNLITDGPIAESDSLFTGSSVDIGGGGTDTANTSTMAQMVLSASSNGPNQAEGQVTSSNSFSVVFGTDDVTIAGMADLALFAQISGDAGSGLVVVSASVTVTITCQEISGCTDANGVNYSFGQEITDATLVNESLTNGTPGATAQNDPPAVPFSVPFADLPTGQTLNVNIEQESIVTVQVQIPEPGTLAILGTGLLGLGFLARRQRNKKKAAA